MTTVFFPASFDPFTLGHTEIVNRAIRRHTGRDGKLIMVVGTNPDKLDGMFDKDTRKRLIEFSIDKKLHRFFEITEATLADEKEVFARYKPQIIIRGRRNEIDDAHEYKLESHWHDVQAEIVGWKPKFKFILHQASEDVIDIRSTRTRDALEGKFDPAELYSLLPFQSAFLFNRILGRYPEAGKDRELINRLVNEELDRENLKRPFAVRHAAPAALMVGGG